MLLLKPGLLFAKVVEVDLKKFYLMLKRLKMHNKTRLLSYNTLVTAIKTLTITPFIIMAVSSCNNSTKENQATGNTDSATYQKGTFGYDLNFLREHDSVIVL